MSNIVWSAEAGWHDGQEASVDLDEHGKLKTSLADQAGTDCVDFTAHYLVDGYRGVAFTIARYAQTEEYEGDYLLCDDEDCDHQLSELCWTEGDTSLVTDLEWVYAVMVGDDTEHLVEVSSLTKIGDDDYCSGCGATDCSW